MSLDLEIVHAWIEASKDLGIRVVAPCKFDLSDGTVALFEARVVDFGSPRGAIAMSEISESREVIRRLELWASTLYAPYRAYSRRLFIETLDDWGWFGAPGCAPAWYTGQSWR